MHLTASKHDDPAFRARENSDIFGKLGFAKGDSIDADALRV